MFAFLAAAALPLLASALTITSPNSSGWEGNTTVTVAWQWTQDDPNFSIELGNPSIQSGLLAQGPIAVGNNIVPNTNSYSFELPVLPAGDNYFIAFVAVDNVNSVLANSTSFPIFANPHSSTISVSAKTGSTSVKTSTTHSSTASLTKNSTSTTGTATGTSTATSTGTVLTTTTTSESITSLIISTLSTSTASTSTSSKGAAVRGVSASWGSLLGLAGFVGAVAIGA